MSLDNNSADNIAQRIANDTGLQKLAMAHSLPKRPVDTIAALESVAACDGDLLMAAADLDTSPQMILAAIVGNNSGQSLLAAYLRAYAMLKTFGVLNLLQEHVATNLGALAPKDAARTLVGIIQGMASLTDTGAAPPMNPYDALMKILPAEDREALRMLVPDARAKAQPSVPDSAAAQELT